MKQVKKVKFGIILAAVFSFVYLISLPSNSSAAVIDAPHVPANGVKCGDCHAYSLWWHYSPAGQKTDPSYESITAAVCNKCHGEGGPEFNKISHSAASMSAEVPDMHNELTGNWSTHCLDCHNPHLQPQLAWRTDLPVDPAEYNTSPLYLITGTLTQQNKLISVITANGVTTSTFDFEGANAPTGSKWLNPADPNKPWFAKTGEGRGLILVINPDDPENTYEISGATGNSINPGTSDGTGTISVNGKIDTTSFGTGNIDFGIIYGQLVKANIDTPHGQKRDVRFFDGNKTDVTTAGGFIDLEYTPPTGVCQVCHTLTDYWLQDGIEVNAQRFEVAPDGHNSGLLCTFCHYTDLGFKPNNADHTFISVTETSCKGCHLPEADIVQSIHKGICDYCHDNNPPTLLGSISTGTGGMWPSTPHTPGDCTDCHNDTGPAGYNSQTGLFDNIAGDFSNHPKAFDSDNDPSNGYDGHDGQLSATPHCVSACHFHSDKKNNRDKDIVTEIHVGRITNADDPDPCIKCHTLQRQQWGSYSGNETRMLTKGSYSGPGDLKGLAVSGQGDCKHCHIEIGNNWKKHKNEDTHEGQVTETGTGLCTRCHQYDTNFPEYIVDILHLPGGCPNCHDFTNQGSLIGSASTNGPGSCSDCHTSIFTLHNLDNFVSFRHETRLVTGKKPDGSDLICLTCHNEGKYLPDGQLNPDGQDMIVDIHWELLYDTQLPTPGFNVCNQCHLDDGHLKGSASGHGISDLAGDFTNCTPCHAGNSPYLVGGFNNCITCHEEKHINSHPTHKLSDGTEMNGSVLPTERCVSCHIGDRTIDVHNDDCLLCHEATFRDQIYTLKLGLPDARADGRDGHLNCIECHTELGNSFLAGNPYTQEDHWKAFDHTNQLVGNPGCVDCHSGNLQLELHPACETCHAKYPGTNIYSGVLKGSASGKGIGKTGLPGNFGNDCVSCHYEFNTHTLNTNLNHDDEITMTPSCGVAGCHSESDLVIELHKDCYTCHSSTGVLTGSASGHVHIDLLPGQPKIPGGGECVTCHSTYFNGHNHGTNGQHNVSEGLSVSENLNGEPTQCNYCHGVLTWSGIVTPNHFGECATCHSSTRNINIGPGYTDIQNVILIGSASTPVICVDCHKNTETYDHYCGDGNISEKPMAGEECDNGNANSDSVPDACRANCQNPSCGDNVIDTGETCDSGANNSNIAPDACRLNCVPAFCGDYVVDTGEVCDNGVFNSDTTANACRTDCTPARCGDGVIDTGETCDDGNLINGDGCSDLCQTE